MVFPRVAGPSTKVEPRLLPIHQNRAALAELMGNSVSVIKTNYRRAIPARVAKEFWAIRPKASKPTKSEIIIQFPTEPAKAVVAR